MKNDIVASPLFETAQALYSAYSTIANNVSLQNTLIEHVDSSFLSSINYKNVREAYNQIILKYYPNESCVKAEFIKQILLKGKCHVTIFELPIGSSRTDLCKINGTSTAYEIKTDLDNFSRLQKQIFDYLTVFDQVYVICSLSKVQEISLLLPNECGIYSYYMTNRGVYHFDLIRKPIVSDTLLNPLKQLELLRKNEFKTFFNLNSTELSRMEMTKAILNTNNSSYINKQFKKILKKRYEKQWNFFKENYNQILEIDYQWFFKNTINPSIIYS